MSWTDPAQHLSRRDPFETQSRLFAGGAFALAGGSSADYLAAWNGVEWSSVGAGMDGQVHALTGFNDTLIAAGDFTSVGGGMVLRAAAWTDPCCEGRRGDVDRAGVFPMEVDTSDLGTLVNFLFGLPGAVILPCPLEADVDAQGGPYPIDTSDLGSLVNFLFSPPGSVVLPDCP